MQETWVLSPVWEDPFEKGMATHSSIFSWEISKAEEPGGLQSMGSQGVGHDWMTNTFTEIKKWEILIAIIPNNSFKEFFPDWEILRFF